MFMCFNKQGIACDLIIINVIIDDEFEVGPFICSGIPSDPLDDWRGRCKSSQFH